MVQIVRSSTRRTHFCSYLVLFLPRCGILHVVHSCELFFRANDSSLNEFAIIMTIIIDEYNRYMSKCYLQTLNMYVLLYVESRMLLLR